MCNKHGEGEIRDNAVKMTVKYRGKKKTLAGLFFYFEVKDYFLTARKETHLCAKSFLS